MKRKVLAFVLALSTLMTGCSLFQKETADSQSASSEVVSSSANNASQGNQNATPLALSAADIVYLDRPVLLASSYVPEDTALIPSVSYQTAAADLSNVYLGGFYLNDEEMRLLGQNGFVLSEDYQHEFFQRYEMNRYQMLANYVTVDSMMHTYHLYFAHLLKKIEREHLSSDMKTVSQQMLSKAQEHYNTLQGTEWEEAAQTELAFFAVGLSLLEPDASIPDVVSSEVSSELSAISNASGIEYSAIFEGVMEDYTQYIPRGYYDTSEDLKKYFKAMMWYGRMGFRQDNETLNRASVLVTLALDGEALDLWSKVYAVTSFFAGAADDFGYYELKPLIDAVYGEGCTAESLIGNDDLWTTFQTVCQELPAPAINSVPVYESNTDEEKAAAQKGFRFMGQRFSIDESCFTQLTSRAVKDRILPDALDFPAALGSDAALSILEQQGDTSYPNYIQNMQNLRQTVQNASVSSWTANLYSAWIYTLSPMLEKKDTAYPPFMRSQEWERKSLLSFEGSYSELKHDTILYSKQMMGEMGGGDISDFDDRGYVEAEPVVFARLKALVTATTEGLSGYGMISAEDKQNMDILEELAGKLEIIAKKELSGELPTEEEFNLIRTFGGQLEHFWEEVMRAEYPDEMYHMPEEHPAAIIADIATDPNGTCLEVGTGKPLEIKVLVEVDGVLKVASGSVFSFYQFTYPMSDRLTDSTWRQMLGIEVGGNNSYEKDPNVQYPWWYTDLMYVWSYN